jgi:hypothetical protein
VLGEKGKTSPTTEKDCGDDDYNSMDVNEVVRFFFHGPEQKAASAYSFCKDFN